MDGSPQVENYTVFGGGQRSAGDTRSQLMLYSNVQETQSFPKFSRLKDNYGIGGKYKGFRREV